MTRPKLCILPQQISRSTKSFSALQVQGFPNQGLMMVSCLGVYQIMPCELATSLIFKAEFVTFCVIQKMVALIEGLLMPVVVRSPPSEMLKISMMCTMREIVLSRKDRNVHSTLKRWLPMNRPFSKSAGNRNLLGSWKGFLQRSSMKVCIKQDHLTIESNPLICPLERLISCIS